MPSKDFMQIFYKEKDQIKGIDRYLLKTLLRVVMLLLTDVPGKQSRSCQFNIFLFVMLNKYGLTAFITSVSNALSAENSMYNQHHDRSYDKKKTNTLTHCHHHHQTLLNSIFAGLC